MCAASAVDLSRDALVRIDFDQAARKRYLPRENCSTILSSGEAVDALLSSRGIAVSSLE